MSVAVLLCSAFVGTGTTLPSLCVQVRRGSGIAMSGVSRKNVGAERDYDRKVDALWDEKRDLVMKFVESIEETGNLAQNHRGHWEEIED